MYTSISIKKDPIHVGNILACAVLLICGFSLVGRIASLERLYTWGEPWTFSVPTSLCYLLLVGGLFFRGRNKRIFAGLSGALAIFSLAISHPEYSIASGIIHLSLSIAILVPNQIVKYISLGSALWWILLGLVSTIIHEFAPVFDPIIQRLSLPTMVTGLMLTVIIFDQNLDVRLNLKLISLREIWIAGSLILFWGILTITVKSSSVSLGYVLIVSVFTFLAILLHYQRTLSRKTEAQRQQLVDGINNSAISVVTDVEGVILMANEHFCEASGYTNEELVGDTHKLVNSGVHSVTFWKEMWDTINSGKPWQGDVCNRNKAGEIFWEHTTITPFFNEKNEIVNFLAVRFDITDKIRQNEALKNYQKEQKTLIQNLEKLMAFRNNIHQIIAHDLRTPLGQIISLSELIEDPLTSDSERIEMMDTLKKRAEESLKEVDSLLSVERKKHQFSDPSLEELHPDDLVQNELDAHRFSLDNKQIRVSSRLLVKQNVLASKQLLTHIVRNLVSNAVKYTPPKGRIHVEVDIKEGRLFLEVSDSGDGIEAEDREKIFQQFYRNRNHKEVSDKSWGLGLAFVYEVICSNNGSIEVGDSRLGGATFTVLLPLNSETEAPHLEPITTSSIR